MMIDISLAASDRASRLKALDVSNSFIVQAPAGSGKTELLIQRVLSLLAVVNVPEEILSITFTRKAAAEMRRRLFDALEQADSAPPPAESHALETWRRACQARQRDHERNWGLLENPGRLQVMTIDSFCASLVNRMPFLSGLGGNPVIAENPTALYRDAAERLCQQLEGTGAEGKSLQLLLAHLDNRLPLLRNLLVVMLGRRDQWLRHLQHEDPESARAILEEALASIILQTVAELEEALGPERLLEMTVIGHWAAGNLSDLHGPVHPLNALAEPCASPRACLSDFPVWQALTCLMLTDQGQLRKSAGLSKRIGFPPGAGTAAEMKKRMTNLLASLESDPVVVARLQAIRVVPASHYSDQEWSILKALVHLLPTAVGELLTSFRLNSQIDFTEVAQRALTVLGDDFAPSELLLQLDRSLRHILVDEFQDTSRVQYDLLATLTAGWEPNDGRTLFLVGDPMQSIYRFREAEVGLYLKVRSHGLGAINLIPLTLTANFRSQAGLVDWCNQTFCNLFPSNEDLVRGAVPFAPAIATQARLPGSAATTTVFAPRDDRAEAEQVLALIRRSRDEAPDGTIAVLVRARSHLSALIPLLKAEGLRYQSQDIDLLADRPAIQDLLALTRALLQPADRIAWLAVLRAPWCGLTLNDLLSIVDQSPGATILECMEAVNTPQGLFDTLSTDGRQRLARVFPILDAASHRKGQQPLRRLVESAWLALGGSAGLNAGDLVDIDQFWALLDELDLGGDILRIEALEERLGGLFAAPDPEAGTGLQLMTIHKAKGLEFDTVILPGLGRTVRNNERALLLWHEAPEHGLLLAPVPAVGSEGTERTYRALAEIHEVKDELEHLRLLYVAATRARRTLHLLGHAASTNDEQRKPASGSLLSTAWPALKNEYSFATGAEKRVSSGRAQNVLQRLPTDWALPELAPTLQIANFEPLRASKSGRQREHETFALSLLTEEGHIVGTVVHTWLERIASDGLVHWDRQHVMRLQPTLRASMSASGVPQNRLDACTQRILDALTRALQSERGRWILESRPEAASELSLTGCLEGQLVHAVIDRTFIDETGVRWVIDYKLGEPEQGETLDNFLAREEERYRPQLQTYVEILKMTHNDHRVYRAALYFPELDVWQELQ